MLLHVKFAHKDGAKAGATAEVIANPPEPSADALISVTTTVVNPEPATAPTSATLSVADTEPVSIVPSVQVVLPASTACSVSGMAAAPTVSSLPDVANLSSVSSAACMTAAPTVPPVPDVTSSYPAAASNITAAPVENAAEAAASVALPALSATDSSIVELEPVQEITELTRMDPGTQEHAAVEHLFASMQQPEASLPVVAGGPSLTVVGSAQHMLHMLSVSQVEEVVSEVCLPQSNCSNVW